MQSPRVDNNRDAARRKAPHHRGTINLSPRTGGMPSPQFDMNGEASRRKTSQYPGDNHLHHSPSPRTSERSRCIVVVVVDDGVAFVAFVALVSCAVFIVAVVVVVDENNSVLVADCYR